MDGIDTWQKFAAIGAGVLAGLAVTKKLLDNPSRPFETVDTVGGEYNKWTTDGILEHYWGEHIHLGYYKERSWFDPSASFLRTFISTTRDKQLTPSFQDAKKQFTHQLLNWSGVDSLPNNLHVRVLDVGCGIGGTSRMIASMRPDWTVTGISISAEQVARASRLAMDRNILNVDFRCCDAMAMPFPDNSFDVVWSCESMEHMPDKEAFVTECARVLKPGGRVVFATWCQRDDSEFPFTVSEVSKLDFLYREWCHPKFASLEQLVAICGKKNLSSVKFADWTAETLPSWRHSIFVGIWSPWAVIVKPWTWWSTIREIVTLERMHEAFRDGLMRYGVLTAVKRV